MKNLIILSEPAYGNERIYNGLLLKGLAARRMAVGTFGACIDARGMTDEPLVEGAHRCSMAELTTWTTWADKVITF